jgi:hypothetical protein
MSLSFVSKSIQTQDEDGDFKETAIEGSENDYESTNQLQRPLFDQLRSNKERDDEEREEFQRAMMRGTLALDEDDAAYLGDLQREKDRQEALKQHETELELAAFHAAKMEQEEANSVFLHDNEAAIRPLAVDQPRPGTAKIVPTIIRRKRKLETNEPKIESAECLPSSSKSKNSEATSSGLGNLLSGYDSDSDE